MFRTDPLFVGLVVVMPLTLGYGAALFGVWLGARRGVASARAVKRTVVAITLIFLGFAGLAALGLTGNLVVAVALVVAYVFVTAALTVVRRFRRSRRAGVGR